MTPLATFGICILLTLVLILLPFFIVGNGFALLVIIFPAIAAESITGERGLDFGRKSFVYLILLWIFIATQVLLIAAIFFGFYCLFWGYPTTVASIPLSPANLSPEKYRVLIGINKILLVVLGYFLCNFIYQTFKYIDAFRTMNKKIIYFSRILPLKIFPLAFIYLIACLIYLTDYHKDPIGLLPKIAGHIYAAYILYGLAKTIYLFARNVRHGFAGFKFNYAIQIFITIVYDITFLYFFFQLYTAIKL